MRKNQILGVAAASVVLIAVIAVFLLRSKMGVSRAPEFQKGMHYASWSKNAYDTFNSDESLRKLSSIGCDWVAILVTWYQDTCFATKVFPTERTPSDKGVIRAIKVAHENNMKVLLKPHLDIIDVSYGGWRGEIACARETDWEEWFENYKKYLLHYVKIANENNVEMFCVGTELTESTLSKPDMWRQLIKDVKKEYRGKVTYAANWNEEYLNVAFWDELDYAGIDAYFPLSDKEKPVYDDLIQGWQKWLKEIQGWQEKIQKPVIFPEVGYHSSEYAAMAPWTHESGSTLDLEVQVACYKAMLDTFWDKDWFYGVYWWDWGTSVSMGGNKSRGFTPQNKPAQDLIQEYYARER